MPKRWKEIQWDDCELCGGTIAVFSEAEKDLVYDGEAAKCLDCSATGWVCADENAVNIHMDPETANDI